MSTSADSYNFTAADSAMINDASLAASAISFVGSIFIVCGIVYFKKWNLFHFKLVFMLSCAVCTTPCLFLSHPTNQTFFCVKDILNAIFSFIGDPVSGSAACIAEAIGIQFATTWSYAWVMAIAYTLYNNIAKMDDGSEEDGDEESAKAAEDALFMRYNLVIMIYTVIMTVIPFGGRSLSGSVGTYGAAGAWCWIDGSTEGQVWRFVAFYGEVWVAMIIIVWMYYKIISRVMSDMSEKDDHSKEVFMTVVYRLCMYPIIMFIGYFFGTINRIHNAVQPNNPSVPLYVLATIFLNINGFANACAYGMNDQLQKDIKRCCFRCLGYKVDDEDWASPDADSRSSGEKEDKSLTACISVTKV